MKDWISIETDLPKSVTKVRWLCKDGKQDIGFFNGEFMTFDPVTVNEITHWQYLDEPDKEEVAKEDELWDEVMQEMGFYSSHLDIIKSKFSLIRKI